MAVAALKNSISNPIKLTKPITIEGGKVLIPKTSAIVGKIPITTTSSKNTGDSMMYTAIWNETEKKFKVTRVNKVEELVDKAKTYVKSLNMVFSHFKNVLLVLVLRTQQAPIH